MALGLGLQQNKITPFRSITLNPTKDAYISTKFADANYNSDALKVSWMEEDENETLLYFDLSSVMGKKIQSAVFKFYATRFDIDVCLALQAGSIDWIENEVTWNNVPIFNTYWMWRWLSEGIGWKYFDAQWMIQNLANDGLQGNFIMYNSSQNTEYSQVEFNSRENANKPQLTIVYT